MNARLEREVREALNNDTMPDAPLPLPTIRLSSVDKIMAYEEGELSKEDTLDMFCALIESGMVWALQGHYGRTAEYLIRTGAVTCTGGNGQPLTCKVVGL